MGSAFRVSINTHPHPHTQTHAKHPHPNLFVVSSRTTVACPCTVLCSAYHPAPPHGTPHTLLRALLP